MTRTNKNSLIYRILTITLTFCLVLLGLLFIFSKLFPYNHIETRGGYLSLQFLCFMINTFSFYLGLIALILPAIFLILGHYKKMTIGLVFAVWFIIPRLVTFVPSEAKSKIETGTEIKITTCNLLWTNNRGKMAAQTIKESAADIIFLQEYTNHIHKHFSKVLEDYPYVYLESKDNYWGEAIYSKFPLSNISVTEPPLGGKEQPQMRVELEYKNEKFVFYNIHFQWQVGYSAYLQRKALFTNWLKRETEKVVVLGDFNYGVLSPQHSLFYSMGWADALDIIGWGAKTTWPRQSHYRWFPSLRLDHVYFSPGVSVRDLKIFDVPGSDHAGVTLTIGVASGAR